MAEKPKHDYKKKLDYKKKFDYVSKLSRDEIIESYKDLLLYASNIEKLLEQGNFEIKEQTDIKEIKEHNDGIFINNRKLKKIKDSLTTRNELLKTSKAEIVKLRNKISTLKFENQTLRKTNKKLSENNDNYSHLFEKIKLMEKNENKKKQKEMFSEMINNDLKKENISLKEKVFKLGLEKNELKTKKDELETKKIDLETKKIDLETKKNTLEEEKKLLVKEKNILVEEKNILETTYKTKIKLLNEKVLDSKKEHEHVQVNSDDMAIIKELTKILQASMFDEDLIKRLQKAIKIESNYKQKVQELEKELNNYQKNRESIQKNSADTTSEEVVSKEFISFLKNILPKVDLFRRSILSGKDSQEEVVKNWVRGFEMVYNQMRETILASKIEIIEPNYGDKFDHHLHETIVLGETDDLNKDEIIELQESGFRYKNILLSPAKVKVQK